MLSSRKTLGRKPGGKRSLRSTVVRETESPASKPYLFSELISSTFKYPVKSRVMKAEALCVLTESIALCSLVSQLHWSCDARDSHMWQHLQCLPSTHRLQWGSPARRKHHRNVNTTLCCIS